jgi:hypothetical protein
MVFPLTDPVILIPVAPVEAKLNVTALPLILPERLPDMEAKQEHGEP